MLDGSDRVLAASAAMPKRTLSSTSMFVSSITCSVTVCVGPVEAAGGNVTFVGAKRA